ncbi:MAG: Bug family tripartite tricarboxylate transporter substrate binding protein [Betaproteobacteria bacterium]
MDKRRRDLLLAAGALAALPQPPVAAQSAGWPTRPIRVIVPFPPGLPLDVILRTVGPRLGTALGQPVVIENRPGAGGNIGFEAAARSPNDGYTLLGTTSNFVANPSLFAKISYDPQKDFTPVIGLIRTPSVLVVAADSPITSLADLIARAKAKPGGLAFASGGNGSLAHFAGELFKTGAGVDALHTPYKSAPDILNSLLSKQTDYAFPVFATALTHVKAGKFRALAVTSQKRMPQLPDAPTMLELLKPGGFDLESENGLVAPAGTPADIVARLNAEIGRILRDPAVADPMVAAGYEMAGATSSEFGARLARDQAKYADIVKRTGMKID